jgi:hypothetical protein
MKTKSLLFALGIVIVMSSCKPTAYTGYIGQQANTQVELTQGNFNVLGSFTGVSTAKKAVLSIKNRTGLISDAKADLLKNARESGVELSGARTLINITTDIVQNTTRLTCTMSAEIIEFTR